MHKNPVHVHLLSLPNTKNASLVPFSTVLIFRLKYPEWRQVGETSVSIHARVQAERDIQTRRFSANGSSDIVCNADMRVGEIRQFCKVQDDGQSLMRAAMTRLNLSARAYHRILKLARTIADLARSGEIQPVHLAEAVQYRPKLMTE
jgi:magnesium chelatase family protein